ncbi:uncharacterized protein EAF01_008832 [Botrytis porri]|uniref:uncharacterized protein n=1 Tax=Botrytis porri TaxID=87229 RepID=UPI001900B76C|nr:uncharacterized protein EAF01_008832 [Botrytis porri]KAF7897866.1 hypothetical protein EAF01_008832 [Botrytis porri]
MISHPDIPIQELTNYLPTELISVSKYREMKLHPVVDLNNPLCWFEHWAETHPDWAASEIAESIGRNSSIIHTWSYAKLNQEANRVAVFITSHGIHGRMIAIDESLPIERKTFLLKDSNSAIYFTEETVDFVPEGCFLVNVNHNQYQYDSDIALKFEKSRDAVAYLLCTLGSTGNPKGVLISCGNLTSFCEAQSEFIYKSIPTTRVLGGVGRFLGSVSRAFDVHVAEMFLAWRHGLSCITGVKPMLLDDLPMALQELKITHAGFVPSLLDQCGLIPSDVPLLRYLGVGGERISQRTLETWGDSESVTLINAYGPTDATIGCASSAIVDSKVNLRNAGRPLGVTVAHILIPGTLTYAKRGVEGELCLTGSLVGIGYHNRDTGAFIENFHARTMYRTGDLVRLMPDDTIESFGRSDDQTKIRGQRLELGEVSEALFRMQLISFIASNARAAAIDEKVEMSDTFEQIHVSIRAGCRKRLPGYMVPDVVIPMNFLPLAPMSEKADVKQLKALFSSIPLSYLLSAEKGKSVGDKTVTVRELNEQELAVVEILKCVVPATSAELTPLTNIFEVGVDSLLAISLSTLMRKAGYTCSVADVLSISTVEQLALLPRADITPEQAAKTRENALKKTARAETAFRDSPLGKKSGMNVEAVRPCSPVQEAVVARSLNKEASALYVNQIIIELASDIDTSKLSQTWNFCAAANEILRICFCQINDDILQVVLKNDFSICHGQNTSTPNLANISLTVLMQDVLMRYQGIPTSKRPSTSALVEYVASQDELAAKSFWVKKLGDYSPLPLTNDEINEEEKTEPQICTRILKPNLSAIEAFASKLHVTLPSLTQAVFGLAIAKLLSTNDSVFGLVLSGRTVPIPNIKKLLAPTITTVPQLIGLRKNDATILDILTVLQKSSGQMLQFQHSSPRSIHKWVEADRPLFNCLFSFMNTGEKEADNGFGKLVDSYMPPDYRFAVEFEARHPSNDSVICAGYTSKFGSAPKVNNLLELIDITSSSEIFDDGEELPEDQASKTILLGLGDFASEDVSRTSTFLRLGIGSVIAIRFAKELRSVGLQVSSSDIGRYPSIAALARAVSGKSKAQSTAKPSIVKTTNLLDKHKASSPLLAEDDKITDIYASTPLQTGILTQTIATGGKLYLHYPAVKLSPNIDIAPYSQGISKPSTPFSEAAKLITERQGKSVEFWLNRLDNYKSIALPSSTVPAKITSLSQMTIQMPLSEIPHRCQEMNIYLQSVALLAYAKTLFCFVKRRDIVFGHVVSGRSLPLPDIEQILGLRKSNPRSGYPRTGKSTCFSTYDPKTLATENYFHRWGVAGCVICVPESGKDRWAGRKLWSVMDGGESRDATEYGLNVEVEQGEDEVIISAGSPDGRINTEDLNLICQTFDEALRDILENPQRRVVAFPEQSKGLPPEGIPQSKIETTEDYSDVADAPMLEVVRAALAEVANLPTDSVTLQTSIFFFGVNSIVAIRVASICRRRDVPISVADILQKNSLGGILRILVAKSKTITQQQDTTIEILSPEAKASALSLLKHPKATVQEIYPRWRGKNITREKIDVVHLRNVWRDLQLRHSVLRTVFTAPIPESAYQIVFNPEVITDGTFTVIPAQSVDEELVSAIKRQVHHWTQRPSTLFTRPISLCVVRTATKDAVLFKIHHSLYDAWSMIALIKEVCTLYTQPSKQQRRPRPQHLPNLPPPQKLHSPPQTLQNLARTHNTSLPTILMLAFAHNLAHLTHTTHPTFGFFQVGRASSFNGAEIVLAPTVNLLPVSIPVSGGEERDILMEIQRDMSQRIAWEQSQLRDVVGWARGTESSQPLFNASLNVLFHAPGRDANYTSPAQKSEELPTPLPIGVPTDFAPKRKIEGETAIQRVDTTYLAKRNLFVDVGEGENDCVDFGIKVDEILMGEEEIRRFVKGVAREVEGVRRGLMGLV